MFSIEKYVAASNPKDSNKLLVKYGFSPAKNSADLVHKLESFTYRFKEKGLKEISEIDTPYKRFVLDFCTDSSDKEEVSNCSGCDCDKKSNIEGDLDTPVVLKKEEEQKPVEVKDIKKSENSSTDKYEKYIMPAFIFAGLITLVILAKK